MNLPPPTQFDRWTFEKTKDVLSTLPGRLGFPKANILRFLDLEVHLHTGQIIDTTLNKPFDPKIEYIFFLLHQYSKAQEVPLTGNLINYKQISGGRVYAPVFEGRVVKPIQQHLGSNPDLFAKSAQQLGGELAQVGDLSFTILALPRIPYTYALWRADEEFPARTSVFLDESAGSYLDAEAHAHLASLTTIRILAVSRALANE
ncbi:MAG: DUF3786 domain-containing protein [Candidatus Hodarchaeota archaeon]